MQKTLSIIISMLVMLCLTLTSLWANNNSIDKLGVATLCLAVTSLLFFIYKLLTKSEFIAIHWIINTLFLYFVVRAFFSPVESLARMDNYIILSGMMAFNITLDSDIRKRLVLWVPYVLIFHILIHSAVAFYQFSEPSYVPLRELMHSKQDISGFFGHRNFFCVYLSMCATALMSYVFLSKMQVFVKLVSLLSIALVCFMVYYSGSRGGGVFLIASLFLTSALVGFVNLKINKSNKKLIYMGGSTMMIAGLVFSYFWYAKVIELRSFKNGILTDEARRSMTHLAKLSEPENPLIGGGSRFYSYESLRVWDYASVNNSLRKPEFVHNEYFQLIVDYGYIGITVAALLGLIVCASIMRQATKTTAKCVEHKVKKSSLLAMQISTLVICLALLAHSTIDFSLHVMPLVILPACFIGLSLCGKVSAWPTSKVFQCLSVLCVFLLSGYLSLSQSRPSSLVLLNQLHQSQNSRDYLREASVRLQLAEISNDHLHYERAATRLMRSHDHTQDFRKLELAESAYRSALDIHPYSEYSLVFLSKILLTKGQLEEAKVYLDRSLHQLGNMEYRFGVRLLLSDFHYQSARKAHDKNDLDTYALHLEKAYKLIIESRRIVSISKHSTLPDSSKFKNQVFDEFYYTIMMKTARAGQNAYLAGDILDAHQNYEVALYALDKVQVKLKEPDLARFKKSIKSHMNQIKETYGASALPVKNKLMDSYSFEY